jgi:hypothetical protein
MLNLNRAGQPAGSDDYPEMSDAQRISAAISDPNLRWKGANVTAYHPLIPLTNGLNGGYVRVHAPSPAQPGSSVSHFSSAVVPNQIMEPSYAGPNHNIELTLELMEDIGWTLIPICNPGTTTLNDTDTLTVARTVNTWDLRVEVTNTGAFPMNNVSATMLGGPAWLVITDFSGTYPNIASGGAAFNTDTYQLNLDNWPGGSFQVDLQVYFSDDCGLPHNQVVTLDLLPPLPTPVGGQTYVNRLGANLPNPFNPSTTIKYELAQSGRATIRVYDVSGQLVRTLVNREHNVGVYETRWDGRDQGGNAAASGVYFYRLESGRFTETRRMVLLK